MAGSCSGPCLEESDVILDGSLNHSKEEGGRKEKEGGRKESKKEGKGRKGGRKVGQSHHRIS